jgi:hypothetical protein
MRFKMRAAAILTTASLLAGGCAMMGIGSGDDQRSLTASPTIPAAEGKVTFGKTKNDNVAVDLTVKHLANPEKLSPPAANYVVWLQPNNSATPQNIGALKVDKDLTGTLQTQTAMHSFDLFITAEGSGQVLAPAGKRLLWTSYSP